MHRTWKRLGAAVVLAVLGGAIGNASARGPADGRVKVAVDLAPGQDLAGVKVVLDYPENAVGIPEFENRPEVKARVADVPAPFMSAPNDTDSELIMAIAGMAALPQGRIFTVDFDRCQGTPAPRASDFTCTVPEASNPKGELVGGATCTVEIVGETHGRSKATKTTRGNAQ